MVTFLNNLPSFDKDNFSNYQPDLNQYAHSKKHHTYMIGSNINDDALSLSRSSSPSSSSSHWESNSIGEQIIVNERCNLIIQYLDIQSRNDDESDVHCTAKEMFTPSDAAEKSRKRDIREVLDTNPESIGGVVVMANYRLNEESSLSSLSSSMSSKYVKKRRTNEKRSNDDGSIAPSTSASHTSAIVTPHMNETIELIEVDSNIITSSNNIGS